MQLTPRGRHIGALRVNTQGVFLRKGLSYHKEDVGGARLNLIGGYRFNGESGACSIPAHICIDGTRGSWSGTRFGFLDSFWLAFQARTPRPGVMQSLEFNTDHEFASSNGCVTSYLTCSRSHRFSSECNVPPVTRLEAVIACAGFRTSWCFSSCAVAVADDCRDCQWDVLIGSVTRGKAFTVHIPRVAMS